MISDQVFNFTDKGIIIAKKRDADYLAHFPCLADSADDNDELARRSRRSDNIRLTEPYQAGTPLTRLFLHLKCVIRRTINDSYKSNHAWRSSKYEAKRWLKKDGQT